MLGFRTKAAPLSGHAETGRPHELRLHRRAKAVRRIRAQVRAGASRQGCGQARARSALPLRRGQADGPAGADGHHHCGGRRRRRRHADGCGDRYRAGRARLPAQRRRSAVRQLRPDPYLLGIRHAGAEGALAAQAADRRLGDEPRHDRAERRLRRHRAQDQRQARRHGLRAQRYEAVLDLQPGRGDFSDLRALRSRPWRHRLGDRRARHGAASLSARRRAS